MYFHGKRHLIQKRTLANSLSTKRGCSGDVGKMLHRKTGQLPEMDRKIVQNERQNNVAIKSNDVVDSWKHQNVFIKLDLLST